MQTTSHPYFVKFGPKPTEEEQKLRREVATGSVQNAMWHQESDFNGHFVKDAIYRLWQRI